MRALRYDRYGSPDVLHIAEMAEPVPGAGEAKVRVRAASLNPLDWKIRAGHLRFVPLFRGPPRGIGCDFAGEIVGIGGGASARHVGERVFGSIVPFPREGALAEFVVVRAERLVPIPASLGFEHAAALPVAGGTALQCLVDHAHIAAGRRVLITGAAGGVGHFALQIAKHHAAHITGVCGGANIDFVRGLGADEALDYAREDFTRGGDRFDVVFDAAGVSSFAAARQVLAEAGCYINTGGDAAAIAATIAAAVFARLTSRQRAIPFTLDNSPRTWERLAALADEGVLRPHIEHTIALEEVADAMRAMETAHARGKIVVRI